MCAVEGEIRSPEFAVMPMSTIARPSPFPSFAPRSQAALLESAGVVTFADGWLPDRSRVCHRPAVLF